MDLIHSNSLAGGRIKLNRIVREVMNGRDQRDLVLDVAPGVGKTRTALRQAAQYGHSRNILYSAPTHALAKESYKKFWKIDGRPDAHYMEGRNKNNCLQIEQVCKAAELGYFPATVICPTCNHVPDM